jgi:hypothetical protein
MTTSYSLTSDSSLLIAGRLFPCRRYLKLTRSGFGQAITGYGAAVADEGSPRPVYEVVLSLDGLARGAIVAIVMVLTLNSIADAQAVFGLIAIAAVCAVSLQPLIAKLAKVIGFATALVAVHVGGLIAFGGLAGVVAWDLDAQAKSVET